MSQILNEVMTANAGYASDFGAKADLPMPPGRRFAILTCMDAPSTRPSTPACPRAMPT